MGRLEGLAPLCPLDPRASALRARRGGLGGGARHPPPCQVPGRGHAGLLHAGAGAHGQPAVAQALPDRRPDPAGAVDHHPSGARAREAMNATLSSGRWAPYNGGHFRTGASRMSDPQAIHLSDYRPPAYRVTRTELTFDLDPAATRVKARLHLERHPERESGLPLRLDGEQLTLKAIAIDGEPLAADEYEIDAGGLTVHRVPERFLLDTEVEIAPEANTALEGLYQSSGMYCTQCEAEGRSEEHTSELQSRPHLVCRLLLEKKNNN